MLTSSDICLLKNNIFLKFQCSFTVCSLQLLSDCEFSQLQYYLSLQLLQWFKWGNFSKRLMHLFTLVLSFLVLVRGVNGTFTTWSLHGGSLSLEVGFKSIQLAHFKLPSSACHVRFICGLSASCSRCLLHYPPPPPRQLLLTSSPLDTQLKSTLSPIGWFWSFIFDTPTEKQLIYFSKTKHSFVFILLANESQPFF